ncbi:C40 family peptidase [Burkholderia cepacia]|uniref:C40 family peptidase n=1 Tax=Burkholderia cepacia TaxID=292 RepID=UPI00158C6D3F|nr:C40 family peptidase [Burkholderia cepacia]
MVAKGKRSTVLKRLCAVGLALLAVVSVGENAVSSEMSSAQCGQQLAQRLTQAALASPDAVQEDGSLYGVQRWTAATRASYLGLQFPGLLSCAYTVSAIFRAACHPIGNLASVSAVDAALSRWPKVTAIKDLKPGDVVFWRPRHTGIVRCPNTHWHVGIAVGDGRTVDNDWWSSKPEVHSVSRLCSTFAYARRAP